MKQQKSTNVGAAKLANSMSGNMQPGTKYAYKTHNGCGFKLDVCALLKAPHSFHGLRYLCMWTHAVTQRGWRAKAQYFTQNFVHVWAVAVIVHTKSSRFDS